MTAREVAAFFPGGKWRGETYETHCSAHSDRHPSLGISPAKNGGVVIHCQAGCDPADVLAAVGLSLKDLAPPPVNGSRPLEPEAVYRYDDERGEPLYEKVRMPGKQFFLRLPGGSGGGIGDVRRVLFGLPELLATKPGETVAIVEGEKDALNVRKRGVAATTNPEGAAKAGQRPKWRAEYTEWLKTNLGDRRFAVFADQDEAGLAHAEAVVASLKAAGLVVVAVNLGGLAEKQDVSDWLGRHSDEEFGALLTPAPPRLFARFLTWDQLLETPELEWRVDGVAFEETLLELFGPPNKGKTFVMMDLCIAIRRGGMWCGREVRKPGLVVYVNADGGRGFAARARAWVEINGNERAPHEFYTYPHSINLYKEADMNEFRAALSYMDEPPAVVVFDTYSRCIPGVNENQQDVASMVVEHLDQIKREFSATVALLHHTGKDEIKDRGSSVILGAMDTQARVDEREFIVSVTCEKQRDAPFFEPIHFDLGRVPGTNATWISWRQSGPTLSPRDRKEQVLVDLKRLVGDEPGVTRERIQLMLDLSESSAERYVKTLVLRGELLETELEKAPGERGRRERGLFLKPASGN